MMSSDARQVQCIRSCPRTRQTPTASSLAILSALLSSLPIISIHQHCLSTSPWHHGCLITLLHLMAKTYKIGVFGPQQVGKTSLTLRCCGLNPFEFTVRTPCMDSNGGAHNFVSSMNLQLKTHIAKPSRLTAILAP